MIAVRVWPWLLINIALFAVALVAIGIIRPSWSLPFTMGFFVLYLPLSFFIRIKREAKKFRRDEDSPEN
jgi:F0F1-type ATP synthase assembly protein I